MRQLRITPSTKFKPQHNPLLQQNFLIKNSPDCPDCQQSIVRLLKSDAELNATWRCKNPSCRSKFETDRNILQ